MAPQVKGTRETELAGVAMVTPLLQSWCAPNTAPIDTHTFAQAEMAQRTLGDYLLHCRDGKWRGVEVKSEEEWTTNLYVETFSNAVSGQYRRFGWVETLRSDYYVAVFLDVRVAVAMEFPALQTWWLGTGSEMDFRFKVPERSLSRKQRNITFGHLVPFTVLPKDVNAQAFRFADNGSFTPVPLASIERLNPLLDASAA